MMSIVFLVYKSPITIKEYNMQFIHEEIRTNNTVKKLQYEELYAVELSKSCLAIFLADTYVSLYRKKNFYWS